MIATQRIFRVSARKIMKISCSENSLREERNRASVRKNILCISSSENDRRRFFFFFFPAVRMSRWKKYFARQREKNILGFRQMRLQGNIFRRLYFTFPAAGKTFPALFVHDFHDFRQS